MTNAIPSLTGATFDEVVAGSEQPVLVDFWAEWCGPCKQIAPALEAIATEQAGKLQIAKLNVDDFPALAQRYNVMSIPTLILFKGGRETKRVTGAKPKEKLFQEIAEFL